MNLMKLFLSNEKIRPSILVFGSLSLLLSVFLVWHSFQLDEEKILQKQIIQKYSRLI